MATGRHGLMAVVLAGGLALSGCGGGGGGGSTGGAALTGTVAIAATGLGANGFNYSQGTYLIGFAFRAKSPIAITELGYYDSNLTGRAEPFSAHLVGVYDLTTHALLATATVTASSPATDIFRWAKLATPLTLGVTDTYAVVAISGANYYTVGITSSEAPIASAIDYLQGAGYSTTASNSNPTQMSTLVEPNAFDAGNIFGQPPPAGTLADFGPNFAFVPAS